MTTDELLQQLSRQAGAVTPLRPPSVRALLWLGGGLLYLTVMTGSVLALMGTAPPAFSALLVLQQVAALATGAIAAYGAFSSVVPGSRSSWRPALAISATGWLLLLIAGVMRDLRVIGTAGVGAETDWPCVVSMAVGGAVLSLSSIRMLRRGAPLTPQRTMFLGGLGALSLASVEACLTRSHVFTSTIVIWHGTTLVLLTAALVWFSRDLLRWPATPASSTS